MKLRIAALIATFRRPLELERLLVSLAQSADDLSLVVVVDNEGSAEVQAMVERFGSQMHYVRPGANLGCGGGLHRAGEYALAHTGEDLSHILVLDDDAVIPPGTLAALAATMDKENAELAYPLVTSPTGSVGWLPGFVHRVPGMDESFQGSPEDFCARFGATPRDFLWAQGICLLVTHQAVKEEGLHRTDFWVRGEDLEFSLRFTAHHRGIFVPTVMVQHLPPAENTPAHTETEYWKHCALIQNMAFVGLRLPHGRRIAWTIAGALRRYFRHWSWKGLPDALLALWRGAVRGEPAGAGSGDTFRERFTALMASR